MATGVTNPFETIAFKSSSDLHVISLLEAVLGSKVTFNCLPLESLAKDKDKLSPSSILIEFTGVVPLIDKFTESLFKLTPVTSITPPQ